jgi:hypothetical protein
MCCNYAKFYLLAVVFSTGSYHADIIFIVHIILLLALFIQNMLHIYNLSCDEISHFLLSYYDRVKNSLHMCQIISHFIEVSP